jgi:competence protein ComEC
MGVLAFGAQALGREYEARWGFIVSAIIMLIASPGLWWDVSFQLSVAATAGILWGGEAVKVMFRRAKRNSSTERISSGGGEMVKPKWLMALENDLSTTLAATLATLPIIMITFGRVSLVSPLINMIILWMVPVIMALGGIILLVSPISYLLGLITSWLLWPILYGFVWVVEVFARLPFASVEVERLPWVLGIGWWMLLGAWWGRGRVGR